MIGCLPTQALAFLAVFVYATHATQAIAFEWKPGLSVEVKQATWTAAAANWPAAAAANCAENFL